MKWLKLVLYFLGIKEVTTFSVHIVEVGLAEMKSICIFIQVGLRWRIFLPMYIGLKVQSF